MVRQKRSVSTAWLIAGAVGAAAIAGTIAYAAWRTRRQKAIVVETPSGGACPPGEHVGGDPDYRWPRVDVFIDQSGFGEALETFGYDVGDWSAPDWAVCEPDVRTAVASFQREYNLVRPTVEQPPTDRLRKDGLIDDPTALAMVYVDGLQQAGLSWPVVVAETRATGVS